MRRFRQQTFGPVSLRERQNADLFFSELMGRPASRALAVREDAEALGAEAIGAEQLDAEQLLPELATEYTAEAYEAYTYEGDAENAEDAEDAPKAPTVTQGADKDEIIVTRADGTKFHVRRKVRTKILTRPGQLRTGFCTDDKRVFFRLRWCEGTQGTIDLGANPQEAFKELMEKVFKQISAGESVDKIKQTIENASVQAFLSVDITKIGDFKITGDVKLDINRTGLTGGSGGLKADTGWLKVGVEVKVGADGQRVLVTGEIPLGGRKIKGKECPVRELAVWWDIECSREIPITITLPPPVDYIEKHEELFLYFDKAKATLRLDPKVSPTPKDEPAAILQSNPTAGTAKLNKRTMERLDYVVGQGYWLTSVDGYTSPEGSRAKAAAGIKWEGNDALSKERAEKVRTIIATRYGSLLRMRNEPGQPPVMIFPPGQSMPAGSGRSENPKLDDKLGKELEGAALDRAVIEGDAKLGVKPFLTANPKELALMTDEDQKFVNDPKNSLRNRAERLFENLRRVEIHLKYRQKLTETKVPSFTLEAIRNCPQDLVEAAQRQWGPSIPLARKDPPICL